LPIFETGLSVQSHEQHGRHASAISIYALVEQKVSRHQLFKVSFTLATYMMLTKKCEKISMIYFKSLDFFDNDTVNQSFNLQLTGYI